MKTLQTNEFRQQAIFLLQEMSTALRYLSTEIDGAIITNRQVDHDLLRRISQALQKQQGHLLKIAENSDPYRIRREAYDGR
ncbi:MAG TPA: hypothetical protein PLJ47_13570 [Candidatus Hydrogenedentes bacterium]|nr:hypothetical protein [Candidatus Hydrogenedentota bacterium]HRK35618.1 hypothetical protein [Candidatus Hydrogenedentota bacterium]